MAAKRYKNLFGDYALILSCAGILLLFFILKKTLPVEEKITISATISIVVIFGVLIIFLMKKINRTKEALRLANETLETKVMERTAALRKSESRYRTIFEHSGTAMVISDPDMVISPLQTQNLSASPDMKNMNSRKSNPGWNFWTKNVAAISILKAPAPMDRHPGNISNVDFRTKAT